jgi:hypothetical protein
MTRSIRTLAAVLLMLAVGNVLADDRHKWHSGEFHNSQDIRDYRRKLIEQASGQRREEARRSFFDSYRDYREPRPSDAPPRFSDRDTRPTGGAYERYDRQYNGR